jgi:hypothetical protein
MEQDPTFAFRIVIDIALKALSPAINDPTTAVLAIDQIHRMLRSVGKRNLRTDEILDASGQLRVIFRTPNWDDFVNLAFSEIRAYGANNLQIVRRMRAMIENLKETLPSHRQDELQNQLGLLEREAKRLFHYPEELALASIPDSQGLGGHSSTFSQEAKICEPSSSTLEADCEQDPRAVLDRKLSRSPGFRQAAHSAAADLGSIGSWAGLISFFGRAAGLNRSRIAWNVT